MEGVDKLEKKCGGNSVVEFQLPKLATRVRFPSPAFSPDLFQVALRVLVLCILVVFSGCSTVYYPDTPAPLMVQQGQGIYHTVGKGQTLWRISQIYHVDIDDIIAANRIRNASVIRSGQKIFIPGSQKAVKADAHRDKIIDDGSFQWPLRGNILSEFNQDKTSFWKNGLRISSREQTQVLAVRSGKVVFSDQLGGYGPTVIIEHSDRLMSVYGNNAQINVRVGGQVNQGDVIANARLGEQAFLYFEIRRRGVAADPLFYLPKI